MLWARVNGRPVGEAPGLPDSTLDSIVAGIVVEDEQIGPRRYIARLGVLFDRARDRRSCSACSGQVARSAPMLVIPILYSGGTPTSFEQRNEWQRAWARFRSGGSPIDYVRAGRHRQRSAAAERGADAAAGARLVAAAARSIWRGRHRRARSRI